MLRDVVSNLDVCKTALLTAVKHRPQKIRVRHYFTLWVMLHLLLASQLFLELEQYAVWLQCFYLSFLLNNESSYIS